MPVFLSFSGFYTVVLLRYGKYAIFVCILKLGMTQVNVKNTERIYLEMHVRRNVVTFVFF